MCTTTEVTKLGYLLLEGGAEFGGLMAAADRRAMELAGGDHASIDIIPAAAAPDGNHQRAGRRGVQWFTSLGARQVAVRPLIDRASAQQRALAQMLGRSRMVYMLGGFPSHLAQSLLGTLCWRSIVSVFDGGGVVGGSSAGAMVLCESYYDPFADRLQPGLGMLPGICIIPHHDRKGCEWSSLLRHLLPDVALLGIDEETGIINDAPGGGWTVYGRGKVVLQSTSGSATYSPGEAIPYHELRGPGNCPTLSESVRD